MSVGSEIILGIFYLRGMDNYGFFKSPFWQRMVTDKSERPKDPTEIVMNTPNLTLNGRENRNKSYSFHSRLEKLQVHSVSLRLERG